MKENQNTNGGRTIEVDGEADTDTQLSQIFAQLDPDERAVMMIAWEKAQRGEMGEDGKFTITEEEFADMRQRIDQETH